MTLLARNIKRYFSFKEFLIVFLAIAISVLAGVGVFFNLKKEVVINDNGKQILVKTMKSTVREALYQNGIQVEPDDFISMSLGSKLQKLKRNEIYIKRAVPVNVLVDGKAIKLMTYRDTVKDTLVDSPVKLSGSDKLSGVSLSDKIVKDMDIRIIRVKEETVTEKIPIAFKTVTRENDRLDKGTQRVLKEGKEGVRQKLFKVIFEDGKEIARELIKDSTALVPISKVVEYGTVLVYKTSRGDTVRYKKVLNMRATAYTASFTDTGKNPGDAGFGITYTGIRAKKGVIAVDPKVIPLGSKVYIEGMGKTLDYGYAVAADIGSAVKGNIIDLYFDDQSVVNRWGCKKVKVYILIKE